jgi:hypothetical protein
MAVDEGEGDEGEAGPGLDSAALKKFIKIGRSRDVTFAFIPTGGDKPDVFMADRRKKPDTFGKNSRKEAEETKVAYGKLRVEGKTVTLTCDKQVPGMDRKVAKLFRKQKVPYEVRIVGPDGEDVA